MIKLYPSRFDFMAKYLYVKQYDKKYNTSFFIDLYKAHITTFNGGYELPDTTLPNSTIIKQNIDDFIKVFNELIDDMKKNGYNKQYPIPVDKNGIIENGCLVYEHTPIVISDDFVLKIQEVLSKETKDTFNDFKKQITDGSPSVEDLIFSPSPSIF